MTPFLFWILKGDLTIIAYAKFIGFLTVEYFLNGLSFRYHCHLVEYPTMPLNLQNPLCIHVSSINASIDLSQVPSTWGNITQCISPMSLKRRDLNFVTFTFIEKEYSIYLLHLHVFQNQPQNNLFQAQTKNNFIFRVNCICKNGSIGLWYHGG